MGSFEDRERAVEAQFGLSGEIHFKVMSRAVKGFGQWAAAQLKLSGKEAASYAEIYAELSLSKSGREDALAKAEKDLRAQGLDFSRHRLEKALADCYLAARQELLG
jgi:hypothetical protein